MKPQELTNCEPKEPRGLWTLDARLYSLARHDVNTVNLELWKNLFPLTVTQGLFTRRV